MGLPSPCTGIPTSTTIRRLKEYLNDLCGVSYNIASNQFRSFYDPKKVQEWESIIGSTCPAIYHATLETAM